MPAAQLKQELGLLEAISIVIGRIIGSGIFRTPGPMMIAVAGLDPDIAWELSAVPAGRISVGLFLLAWLVGALATWLAALCYAELVAMLPRSGGPYEYLRQAYPEWVSFIRGWAMFFVSETASIVAVALVFSSYSAFAIESLSGWHPAVHHEAALALLIIWLLTGANFFGVFTSGILQNIFSMIKFLSLLALVAASFGGAPGSLAHFQDHWWPAEWSWQTLIAFGAALRFAFFAYSGWEGATYVAEEVKEPSRNLPLSLFGGIGAVMVLYFIVNLAYVWQLDPAVIIAAKKEVASRAMQNAVGPIGGLLLAAAVMLSTFGNVNTQILVKARTWFAMARDGLFFQPLARLSHRGTPNNAMIAQGLWASVLLAFALSSEMFVQGGQKVHAYDKLISFFSFTSALFNVLTFAAVIVLRRKMPLLDRPFRVPFFALTTGITLLLYISFMIITLIDKPLESIFGIALTATGFAYYFFIVRPRVRVRQ
ncbi:MAG: amino acid permease [Leptospiraceae bacterium]|nr:amino acid permease [Leptospiraceae bacterium]